jgi:hypothetical protein
MATASGGAAAENTPPLPPMPMSQCIALFMMKQRRLSENIGGKRLNLYGKAKYSFFKRKTKLLN